MHPVLGITMEHVQELESKQIRSLNRAKEVLREATEKNRSGHLYPELSKLAGLCQRVIVNPDAFKTMRRLRDKALGLREPANSARTVIGAPIHESR